MDPLWLGISIAGAAGLVLVLGLAWRSANATAAMRRIASAPPTRTPAAAAPAPAAPATDPAIDEDTGTTLADDAHTAGKAVSFGGEIDVPIDLEAPEADGDDPSGLHPLIALAATGATDQGRKRKHNEDAIAIVEDHGLYAIADGMGGYAAGEVAAQMAVDTLASAFRTGDFGAPPIPGLPRRGDELVRAIQTANAAILRQARENEAQAGMGTTIVSARFSPRQKRVYLAHVGDSRIYRLRTGHLQQLTEDHTLGAAGVTGPAANKLSRAVGVFDEVEVDLNIDEPQRGDFYLLCSDGLFKMVPEPEIQAIIERAPDLETAVTRLIEEANARGGKDNVSVVLVRIDAPGAVQA